jgi:myo-inositol-1-phosphate synthase
VLLPGMGAVATTCIAGVELVRRGLGVPVGSTTQLGTIRLGKGAAQRVLKIRDFVPLASLSDLVFAGWDVFADDCYTAALKARVLENAHLDSVKELLQKIRPMPAVFDHAYVPRLRGGTNIKSAKSKTDLAQRLIEDIERFRSDSRVDRVVMIWCGSTEIFMERAEAHQGIKEFEAGLRTNDPAIAPSMIYAYAALKCRVPFVNGTPNLSVDIPALVQLAESNGVPVAGKDLKTGQTLVKTVLAAGLKARLLGLRGWFSSNILGNRDGEVLDDPMSFKTKEASNSRYSNKSSSPSCIRNSMAISITWSGSTITHRVVITRRVGTISTLPAGSIIRCKSRWTSSAEIPFWPRPSSLIWRYSSTWPTEPK